MINILRRELKRNRRSFIMWTIAMALMNFAVMSVYPTIAKDQGSINEILNQMPDFLLKAFNLDKLNMADILGYYGTKGYISFVLFGSIFSILLGSSILSKEENDKTIEFLLAKPITRGQMITSKVLCYLIYIFLFNLIVSVVTYISFEGVKIQDFSLKTFLMLSIAPFVVNITFANIGILASIFVTRRRVVYSFSIGLVMGMYFISTMAEIAEELKFLGYFTPFKYADAVDIIVDGGIKGVYWGVLLLVNVAAIGLTYWIYGRKDIVV